MGQHDRTNMRISTPLFGLVCASILIAVSSSASLPCPPGCKCESDNKAPEGSCKTSATCPCGTTVSGAFDCVYFQQAKKAIGTNEWIKTIPSSARRVGLFGCGLKEIPDGALSHLTKARVLNLEYNGLTKIGAGAFQGMSKLKVLWLTGHHLRPDDTPPEEYNPVAPLKNQISSIDADAFSSNPNLTVLLMHHNKLS